MNKRQYIFLFLLTILLYLSYNIIEYEYQKFMINKYKDEQRNIIANIRDYLLQANKTIEYKKSAAYKNKVLKAEQGYKIKGEEVVYFTQEQTYNKFKTTETLSESKPQILSEEESITKTMTNFQKWVYFLMKKDLR